MCIYTNDCETWNNDYKARKITINYIIKGLYLLGKIIFYTDNTLYTKKSQSVK